MFFIRTKNTYNLTFSLISATVLPRPLGYCSVAKVGMLRMLQASTETQHNHLNVKQKEE